MSDNPGNINVAVRVRPLLPREDPQSECLVHMPPSDRRETFLRVPESSTFYQQPLRSDSNRDENLKRYTFDDSIWSFNPSDPNYTDNHLFYNSTSTQLLDHFFQGFNVCFLAYGQTGSGKTHTMMGNDAEPGMIPLLVKDILYRMECLVSERINCQLKLQYMEIYNEQVKDLLVSKSSQQNSNSKCRIREHPVTGPFVENLVEYQITNFQSFLKYLERGNKLRSTASTSMNEQSSRSHAILTLSLTQTKFKQTSDDELSNSIGEADEEVISNIKLVDLAGSERLYKTKVFKQQERIKEGTSINKSLTVLGRCINILSEKATPSSASSGQASSNEVVPYRDSVLTYILKENLAGNSKTYMLFCISPIDFEETQQTLNYANQVKRVKTSARANKKKITDSNKRSYNWEFEESGELKAKNAAVTELKNEVQKLSQELNELKSYEQRSLVDQEKWNKLTSYLENQSSTISFENKFLHSKLKQKANEIEELQSQLIYVNHEVEEVIDEIERKSDNGLVGILSRGIIRRCELNIKNIDEDLSRFEPRLIF